jgi:Dolichyl-phosphate-mannose-protein mannosyltransferase
MCAEPPHVARRGLSWEALALAVALVLAALLRFGGLGFGLRHQPHWDERVFVTSVSRMLAAGDLDHRFYEYPGLFVYVLAPLLAVLPPEAREGPRGYLLARGLVAAFGVLSVALSAWLGRRLGGPWAGAAAALLVAVSPVEVVTAHTLRPDVVLESFVLAALLVFARLGQAAARDVGAGLVLGAATAVKFSGALLAPAYVVARLLAPGPKLRRVLLAGGLACLAFFIATPYALLHWRQFFGGVGVQWAAHYGEAGSSLSVGEVIAYYLGATLRGLGPLGCGLLALGVLLALRSPRPWAPLLTQVAVTMLVFSTADRRYERFLVPVLGLLAILAGRGLAGLALRSRALGALLLAAAVAWPLWHSAGYVANVMRPGTRDLALDWIEAHAPDGARVLNGVDDLGLGQGRLEVLRPTGAEALDRLLARGSDLSVWAGATPALSGYECLFRALPLGPESGPGIGIYRPPELRAPPARLQLTWARLSASSASEAVPALADGRLDTLWSTDGPQRPGDWVQLDLPRPVRLTRVDLLLGRKPLRYGRNLHLLVTADGVAWERVRVASGRPPIEEQRLRGEGASQVLWIEAREVRGVRVLQAGSADRPWAVAELRLFVEPEPAEGARPSRPGT